MPLRIAFFGQRETFDYYHISGLQSLVRRLSTELLHHDVTVDYLMYGADAEHEITVTEGLILKYFTVIEDAIRGVSAADYDHIVDVRIPEYRDRVRFVLFVRRSKLRARFHYLYFVRSDSLIKRWMMLLEAKLVSRNGRIICVSPRLLRFANRYTDNAAFVIPPVSQGYFRLLTDKSERSKIRIVFLGVIFKNKGFDEVVEIFKCLSGDPRFQTAVHAIYEPLDPYSVRMRDWLLGQKIIEYVEVDRYNYSSVTEETVQTVLGNADIFIQPYTSLGSTVDTPLLILEAMASLCAVVSTPLGSIPEVYGSNDFLFNLDGGISPIVDFLKSLSRKDIREEQERICQRNQELQFEASAVAQRFLAILEGKS